jgi:putative transposase
MSLRSACGAFGISRSVYRYQPNVRRDESVISALQELAERHPRYGFGKMYPLLCRQGHGWNHKRVYRVYKALGLNIRRRCKKRIPGREPEPLSVPADMNVCWSIDFMGDSLWSGSQFRTFNVMDDYNREGLAIEVDHSLPAPRVVRVLDRVAAVRSYPNRLRADNGPELTSVALAEWAEEHGVELEFIQPGRPMQNGFIERFNRTFREEVLDMYVFRNIGEVRQITENWLTEYNEKRPHEALGNMTPKEYAASIQKPENTNLSVVLKQGG